MRLLEHVRSVLVMSFAKHVVVLQMSVQVADKIIGYLAENVFHNNI